MGQETFLISDTHFGHKAILNFLGSGGGHVRKGFSNAEEMDEVMVENWNRVVRPHDKVYHLGDVAMDKKCLPIVGRLNGKKSLVMGNHDIFDAKLYLKWFSNVRAVKVFDRHIFTHMPVLPTPERFTANVHGHIHERSLADMWYYNVSVERVQYTPMPWYVIKRAIEKQQEVVSG